MKRKAQIQMGETIFVILVIIFLIVLAFTFVYKGEEISTHRRQTDFYELDSVALGQLITNLPELACSTMGTRQQSCFDKHKITAFSEVLNNNPDMSMQYYFEKLVNVNITIVEVYPNEGRIWEIYVNNFDVKEGETLITQSYGTTLKIPTIIRDSTRNIDSFGVLYVTKYRRI